MRGDERGDFLEVVEFAGEVDLVGFFEKDGDEVAVTADLEINNFFMVGVIVDDEVTEGPVGVAGSVFRVFKAMEGGDERNSLLIFNGESDAVLIIDFAPFSAGDYFWIDFNNRRRVDVFNLIDG